MNTQPRSWPRTPFRLWDVRSSPYNKNPDNHHLLRTRVCTPLVHWQVAVVNSSSPAGPWVSPLTVPLLPASLGSSLVPSTTIRDPCAFTDDDGTQYIVFGTFECVK